MNLNTEHLYLENLVQDISKDFEKSFLDKKHHPLSAQKPYQSIPESSIHEHTLSLDGNKKDRILSEFNSHGPLDPYLDDESIIEIMISSKDTIWVETNKKLFQIQDRFYSDLTYNNFIHRLCEEAQIQTTFYSPFANGIWRGFRVHLTSPPITDHHTITLRKIRSEPITLDSLHNKNWCSLTELEQLKKIVDLKKNCLVVGNTGSGKTTLLNALVNEAPHDRCVFIEDTSELIRANSVSIKLNTRFDSQGVLPEITQSHLVKESLRMRPDRLIIGETRGSEAKDLLMALATGHKGSMTSIHAHSPAEALLRLEMLIQMGAPQWNIDAIRRLIQFTIDCIIVTQKEEKKWQLEGIYKISSQEKFGFITEPY